MAGALRLWAAGRYAQRASGSLGRWRCWDDSREYPTLRVGDALPPATFKFDTLRRLGSLSHRNKKFTGARDLRLSPVSILWPELSSGVARQRQRPMSLA